MELARRFQRQKFIWCHGVWGPKPQVKVKFGNFVKVNMKVLSRIEVVEVCALVRLFVFLCLH